MLNIKELRKQFDEILNSFTEQDLLKWLEFAEQRENLQKLSKGEIVKLQVFTHEIAKVNKETMEKTNQT